MALDIQEGRAYIQFIRRGNEPTRKDETMTNIKTYPMGFLATLNNTIYVLELARKGCTKINATSLPVGPGPEVSIPLNKVPLSIRRAARQHLGLA